VRTVCDCEGGAASVRDGRPWRRSTGPTLYTRVDLHPIFTQYGRSPDLWRRLLSSSDYHFLGPAVRQRNRQTYFYCYRRNWSIMAYKSCSRYIKYNTTRRTQNRISVHAFIYKEQVKISQRTESNTPSLCMHTKRRVAKFCEDILNQEPAITGGRFFSTALLTLNFDLDLWIVNSDIWHGCWTYVPNFMNIGLILSINENERHERTK